MYAPAYARVSDEAVALEMIAAQPFATLAVATGSVPHLAYAPFVRDPAHARVLAGLSAQGNPAACQVAEHMRAEAQKIKGV
jgi:predicted FMN-binding regulatory protein PaiB